MHAALDAPAVRTQVRQDACSRWTPASRWRSTAATGVAVAALLVLVSVCLADGLLANIVAYERDTSVFYFPLMSWAAERLRAGELPLWTPQVFGGYPIFADGEVGLAYPPVLLALLVLSPERAFVILRLVHLWLAALGAYALARTWHLPRSSGVVAGLVFALGNFLQAQIHHENIVRTAGWLPLVLALTEHGLRSRAWRARTAWTVAAGLGLGLAGLSLHSQMLAIDLLVLAAYGAFRWAVGPLSEPTSSVSSRRVVLIMTRLGCVARVQVPVVLLGLGLAAVQLIPLLELASFSPRGNGIPYAEAAAYSLTTFGLPQLVFPFLFRGPGNLQWGLWTHWESYVYIGLAPLVLAIVALVCVRGREVAGWGLLGGLGLLLALGEYSPVNLHYYLWLLPGLSGLRAPGRFTLLVVLAGGMLAAYGLAWLQTTPARRPSALWRLLLGLGVLAGVLVVLLPGVHATLERFPEPTRAWISAQYLALPRDTYPLTNSDVYSGLLWATDLHNPHGVVAVLGLAIVVAAVGAWQLSQRRSIRHWRGWPAVLIGLTALDLLVFAWSIHPRASLDALSSEDPAINMLESVPSGDGAPTRVLASPVLNQLSADRLAPSSLEDANGYSSLQFIWHRDLLGRVLYVDDGLLDLWDVRYVIDPARFGAVSSYKDVSFLPQQALLHGAAGSPLAEQTFAMAPGTPVAEVRLVTAMMGAVEVRQATVVADLELRDADGNLVGTGQLQAGRDTMDWAANLPGVRPFLKHQPVEVAGLASEGGNGPQQRQLAFADLEFVPAVPAASLTVRVIAPQGELAVYGGAIVDANGGVQQLFGRTKSKYQQVYADDQIRVLRNTAAWPRAFVVPEARVSPGVGAALGEMVHRPFDPEQQVILASEDAARIPPGATFGGRGTAQVTAYASGAISVHTSTDGPALLVLTDTYYPGWQASVDGQAAPLVRGDVLFRVVPVPAGQHDVEFRFEPRSVKLGLAITSGASACALVGLLLAAGGGRWRRRTT